MTGAPECRRKSAGAGPRRNSFTAHSGAASRLLITSVIVNPVDAVRTGALLAGI